MKIVKRNFMSSPSGSITIWLIPTSFYFSGKIGGIVYHREWIWWILLPTLFLFWVFLNFKIKK